MVRFLTEADIDGLVDLRDALEAVTDALRDQGLGTSGNAPRSRARLNGLALNVLGGSVASADALGAKVYVTGNGAAKFWGLLFDAEGALTTLYEADRLGQLRTGAASGISASTLAPPATDTVAIIGTGYQARTQAEAVLLATGATQLNVYGRNAERAAAFAEAVAQASGATATTFDSIDEAIASAQVVITMTSAHDPVLLRQHVLPGRHYIFAGSNNPKNAEVEPEAFAEFDLIVTDDRVAAQREGGTLIRAADAGTLDWADVGELGDLIARGEVRGDADAITAFVSQGAGSWDTALAAIAAKRAAERGIGVELPIDGAPARDRR
ncbi:ornithine cyclodeaminase family protein [Gulosibacter faecalis]|uniref:Ornithine cyclodeaminase family protein n=1 Tax=Gulosibacter faecalis TaxID=272240 RepID=A0ABW5V1J6_9MICO|nr:ornithine cyclodeaminase family protein [Gulosibacter faecalis]